jgi:hypothetical protein
MELEGSDSETLRTQAQAIYQFFCVFYFFTTTHRLGCEPLLTLLEEGGGECTTFGTKVPAFSFSVNIYASRRCHWVTVLITTRVTRHSFALR